ncbi:MAG TPA: ABC transporter ATP-binding protein [Candidatus Krumholzibacteria bacterium]|nr:ABC transporter ATP-binding protein [Candidatus Krumholzibacteria bacterium]
MIKIQHLHKAFGELVVLDDVSLEIHPGSVTAILGPNASGKSTLIKCILGLVHPDRGKILIDDVSIRGQSHYRTKVGYMPQIARFPENLTVDELFAMVRDLREDIVDVDIELFARYELGAIGTKRLGTLSGGTRQKIVAALAFLFVPRILVLDEPTVGLDPVSTTILKDKVIKERAAGKTILLSSHLVNEVEEMADHIVYLLDGKPVFNGTMAEVKATTAESRLDRALVQIMEKAKGASHGTRR